jgi:DNA mismatch repair protein MutL
VERPVSVVKELVENSLDAGAGKVIVDLEEGGLGSISVIDNGCGLEEEDLPLAFQRHATSKIRCASDLTRVLTLGFRGEALPSIAAVSKLRITTRTRQALSGTMAVVEGGSLIDMVPAGCPPGTTVAIRDLFYNTPARRKTMKSPSSEGALCGDLISRLALARPDVSFELRTKGRRIFYSTGSGKLLDTVTAVYGVHQAREMIAINASGEGPAVSGFTGKPTLSRSTRSHITIIINGRYVRCPAIAWAVEEAYRTLLPQGRRPVAVLSFSIPPEMLDVNVHPAKLEVKLLDEEKVAGFVAGVIRGALRNRVVIPSTIKELRKKNFKVDEPPQVALAIRPENCTLETTTRPAPGQVRTDNKPVADKFSGDDELPGIPEKAAEGNIEYDSPARSFPSMFAIGQLPPTYILAGGRDGLYIIDQHAAHERILFEEFQTTEGEKPSQCLLVPATLELDYREAAVLTEKILWFSDAGFLIEHFGGNTFLLRGVPLHFPAGREKDLFLDILDYFRERGPSASRLEFYEHLAGALACRNAVKAGEKLSQSSMDNLLLRLGQTKNPFTCPHGRPTVIEISYKDLENRFKR